MGERPCGHRWWASRVECETLPVLHVCNEPWEHHADHALAWEPVGATGITARSVPIHRCACGAALQATGPAGGWAAPP